MLVEDLTKGIPFPNSPKEGDMIEWDMGNRALPAKHLDRTAWYVGRFRFKSWEDCDGDGEFGWNCYIQGEDDEEISQVFLQDVPFFILKHCQACSNEGDNAWTRVSRNVIDVASRVSAMGME